MLFLTCHVNQHACYFQHVMLFLDEPTLNDIEEMYIIILHVRLQMKYHSKSLFYCQSKTLLQL